MVALGKHYGHVLGYALPAEEGSVPLLLVLAAVGVVACRKDKRCVGMLLKISFDKAVEIRIVGGFKRLALLLVGNTEELEFFNVFRLGCEEKLLTAVSFITAVVVVFCAGLEVFEVYPMHHTDVNIAFKNLVDARNFYYFVTAVLTI